MQKRKSAYNAAIVALAVLPALVFTPIRPLSALKEQDADHIVASAPISAQVTVPRRYVVGKDESIANLTSITNALTNGQILLQAKLKEAQEAYAAVSEDYGRALILIEQWRTAYDREAARVERVTAALDERRAEYVEKRDAAVLPSTKAIYQAFIDAIDKIKEKIGGDE